MFYIVSDQTKPLSVPYVGLSKLAATMFNMERWQLCVVSVSLQYEGQPVDDVEYEEKNGKGLQKKLVNPEKKLVNVITSSIFINYYYSIHVSISTK
jgi:hypothetical protein